MSVLYLLTIIVIASDLVCFRCQRIVMLTATPLLMLLIMI